MSYPVIKVSEIAEYVYCGRAWWLRVEVGYTPRALNRQLRGRQYHSEHRANVSRGNWARRLALVLLFLAASTLVFWLIRTT